MSALRQSISEQSRKMVMWCRNLSFRTGVIILICCIPCYVISFAQFALDISYTLKGVLWVVFFGLAKTFQYLGLTIIGVEGLKRLRKWWQTRFRISS